MLLLLSLWRSYKVRLNNLLLFPCIFLIIYHTIWYELILLEHPHRFSLLIGLKYLILILFGRSNKFDKILQSTLFC